MGDRLSNIIVGKIYGVRTPLVILLLLVLTRTVLLYMITSLSHKQKASLLFGLSKKHKNKDRSRTP